MRHWEAVLNKVAGECILNMPLYNAFPLQKDSSVNGGCIFIEIMLENNYKKQHNRLDVSALCRLVHWLHQKGPTAQRSEHVTQPARRAFHETPPSRRAAWPAALQLYHGQQEEQKSPADLHHSTHTPVIQQTLTVVQRSHLTEDLETLFLTKQVG